MDFEVPPDAIEMDTYSGDPWDFPTLTPENFSKLPVIGLNYLISQYELTAGSLPLGGSPQRRKNPLDTPAAGKCDECQHCGAYIRNHLTLSSVYSAAILGGSVQKLRSAFGLLGAGLPTGDDATNTCFPRSFERASIERIFLPRPRQTKSWTISSFSHCCGYISPPSGRCYPDGRGPGRQITSSSGYKTVHLRGDSRVGHILNDSLYS